MITDAQAEAAAEAIWDSYRFYAPDEFPIGREVSWAELSRYAAEPDAAKSIVDGHAQCRAFARAALEAGMVAGNEWLPMTAFPSDNRPVQRWHKIHKAPITVRYVGDKGIVAGNGEVLPWLEASGAHAWPDEAFTAHFRPLPTPPTEGDR